MSGKVRKLLFLFFVFLPVIGSAQKKHIMQLNLEEGQVYAHEMHSRFDIGTQDRFIDFSESFHISYEVTAVKKDSYEMLVRVNELRVVVKGIDESPIMDISSHRTMLKLNSSE